MSKIAVEVSQGIATITLNREKSLNALTAEDYDAFANALRVIDRRPDVLVTIWQAHGRWFCAGTDVKGKNAQGDPKGTREVFLKTVAPTTTDCGQALYSHSKILVAALNGPVLGIAAAFLGYFDFIYSIPTAWLSVPFTFLGLVAEGGASVTFVNRMGVSMANEMLIWGKKKTAQELLASGFINQIFPAESFHSSVRSHLLVALEGLDPTAVLTMKRLIKAGLHEKNNPDAVNLRESYQQADRFASGIPDERFGKISRKEIRHKL